ncbi:hypothetical protein E1B28_000875 [Marasmius oreades]|uniref:Uncharacterized protein n=1 Tax=Marasmius oreades TaxID=181124 RepID=A0A9P7V2C3_9AGAR|nr:uncharacterized protein E1B28_000875 [Marasmius oreades]KAG7098989.1 hypothetical protein E1B28_000875 [Marasmius oreades]
MAYYRDPYFAAEPFEEQYGRTGSRKEPSAEALKAFYADMEKKELERKLSKRSKGSIFKRKSAKPIAEPPSAGHPQQHPSLSPTPAIEDSDSVKDMESLEYSERTDSLAALPTGRSLVPDLLKTLPEWYSKDHSSAAAAFRMRYPIYNPVGPRYYRNFHLIPPSELRRTARPPTVFSPFFPPMTTSTHDRSEDSTRLPTPNSRTPSGSPSPLPTPSSSQTRVTDGAGKPRSRKTSQTAHDGVDLLDVSDPWGTNWHHESPYDVGLGHGPVSAEVEAKNQTRSRRSSMTTRETRRRTINPSPLSQSTSAIHLQVPEMDGVRVTRKLSKRRTPLWSVMFGAKKSDGVNTVPIDPSEISPDAVHLNHNRASSVPLPKQARRGSVLGRLAKKFSVTRKPPNVSDLMDQQDSQNVQHPDRQRQSLVQERQPSPEKLQRRVPPPAIDATGLLDDIANHRDPSSSTPHQDRGSYVSVEATPYSIGRLTVANPDLPNSEASMTPAQGTTPLLPEKNEQLLRSVHNDPETPVSSSFITSFSTEAALRVSNPSPPSPTGADSSPNLSFSQQTTIPRTLSPEPPEPIEKSPTPILPRVLSPDSKVLTQHPQSRYSLEDKPLPKPSDHKLNPEVQSRVNSKRRQPSSGIAPPPPSTTTKPKSLPPQQIPSTVPFPAPHISKLPSQDYPHAAYLAAYISESDFSNSPLSTASMLANPPTPQMPKNIPIESSTESEPPPRVPSKRLSKPKEENKKSREPSPGISAVTSRETETFKLVRSASGNVYASTQTITAAGEQWEVVEDYGGNVGETSQTRNDQKSSKRDSNERVSRKESRKLEKERTKAERDGERCSRRRRSADMGGTSSSPRGSSTERQQQRPPSESSKRDDRKGNRSKEQTRERGSSRKAVQSSTPPIAVNKPQSPSPPTPEPSTRPLARNPSTSARPTSEVPPSADLNALRAREMWEMERLYKARSMTDNAAATIPPSPMSTAHEPSSDWKGGVHGSSHTSFVVQNTFPQEHASSSIPQIYHSHSMPRQTSQTALSAHEIFSHSPNPLPEPPRQVASISPELWSSYTSFAH